MRARGDVFGKQAEFVFAEFLYFLLIFPEGHSCVGLTMVWDGVFLLCGLCHKGLKVRHRLIVSDLILSDLHWCCWERGVLLLLILA